MSLALAFVLSFAAARTASAGVCLSEEEANQDMQLIEVFAKDKSKGKEVDEAYGWLCVQMDALRFKPRIERACKAILDRDGIKSPCTIVAASAGFARLGAHDVYAAVMQISEDPIASAGGAGLSKMTMVGRMGDPRAVPVILETWKAAIPRAEQREKRRLEMGSWSLWRQDAAGALGRLGGKDELAFLDEQAKATKDRFVAKACRDAIAAIEKRLAAAAAPKP